MAVPISSISPSSRTEIMLVSSNRQNFVILLPYDDNKVDVHTSFRSLQFSFFLYSTYYLSSSCVLLTPLDDIAFFSQCCWCSKHQWASVPHIDLCVPSISILSEHLLGIARPASNIICPQIFHKVIFSEALLLECSNVGSVCYDVFFHRVLLEGVVGNRRIQRKTPFLCHVSFDR